MSIRAGAACLLLVSLPVRRVSGAAASASPVSFHSMFSGGAVLQRDVNVTVWGTGPAHGTLAVQLGGSGTPAAATVGADGTWSTVLPPHRATPVGTRLTLTVTAVPHRPSGGAGSAGVASTDSVAVAFGETLLCSGQSNMGMPVANTLPCCQQPPATRPPTCHCFAADNGTAEIAAAGRYTGKIQLATVQSGRTLNGTYCPYPWTNRSCVSFPEWNQVTPGARGTLHGVSAVCWYEPLQQHLFWRTRGAGGCGGCLFFPPRYSLHRDAPRSCSWR